MRVGGWKYNPAIQVELAAEADEIINFILRTQTKRQKTGKKGKVAACRAGK